MISRRRGSRRVTRRVRPAPAGVARTALVVVLAVLVVVALFVVWRRSTQRTATVVTGPGATGAAPQPSSTPGRPGVPAPAGTATTPEAIAALPKPRPVPMAFEGCPPTGDGGDPATNQLKSRGDSAAWVPVTIDALLALPWPAAVTRRDRANWARADVQRVARYEGAPVSAEGYFASGKLEGPESVNCHGADTERRDWHLWLSATAGPARERSVVVETTPLVRARHPRWDLATVRALARDGTPVRVSGWLMLDPEHPDQVGKTRGTIWEIHPILAIEVRSGSAWVPLDDYAAPRASAGGRRRGRPARTP